MMRNWARCGAAPAGIPARLATAPAVPVQIVRALQFSSAPSWPFELRVRGCPAARRARGPRRRVRAQLADSHQLVEEPSKAGAAPCVLVVGATGGVGATPAFAQSCLCTSFLPFLLFFFFWLFRLLANSVSKL